MGYFLAEERTLNHLSDKWEPKVQDRNDYAKWEKLGKLSMEERAHQIVLDTIENYVPKPLTEKQEAGIQAFLDATDAASKRKAD